MLSPDPPTRFHRFRLIGVPPLARQVLQPVGPARDLDDVAVVADAVRDGARRHVVAEHLPPPADADVGGDDRRALLVARRDELEEQVGAALPDVEVPELVDDEQLRVRVVLEALLEDPAGLRVLQALDEPRAVHEPHLAPRAHGLDADGHGEVGLAHARAADEQHVLGALYEPERRELLDAGPRHARLEVPVEVGEPLHVGEARGAYALADDPGLPRRDLDAGHLLERGAEVPLAGRDHAHVVGQRRRHLVEPKRREVVPRPDRGARLGGRAHSAPPPPSASSRSRLARAAARMSPSAQRLPSSASR